MKYTPKELKGNVNISHTSPIREFFLLLGASLTSILLIYLVLGFAVNLIVTRLPSSVEENIGSIILQRFENRNNASAGVHLQKLLDDLLREYPHGETHFQAHLLTDNNANAMALPGGNIIVFSALINEVQSENELAFVLAHELGHFANRDHLKGVGRMLVVLAITTTLFGADNFLNNILINSLINVEMKFSQKQEKDADFFALELLQKKYGQVAGATDFFEKLGKKDKRAVFHTTSPLTLTPVIV